MREHERHRTFRHPVHFERAGKGLFQEMVVHDLTDRAKADDTPPFQQQEIIGEERRQV